MILIDTCVLLDVVQADPRWADWSQTQLELAADHGGLLINPIVYAEFSVWYNAIEDCERTLAAFGATLEELPREALFLAGKAFRRYRSRGGTRTSVLPDFFIGAHAAVRELPLLTRDPARIRAYFPSVALITPTRGRVLD
jgi:predicted nucleic acid-binding protein